MNKLKKYSEIIRNDSDIRKRIFLVTIFTALFILALVIRKPVAQGRYIVDESGNVVGIQRGSLATSEEYRFDLKIRDGNDMEERPVVINKQAMDDKRSEPTEEDSTQERNAEITGIITNIELSEEQTIYLPSELSDGSKLFWSIRKEDNRTMLFIPLCYVMLILLIIRDSIGKDKDLDRENRKTVLRGLPRFTNQLLLMMNAGMILSDALEKICDSYRVFGIDRAGVFESELIELTDINRDHRMSAATLINEFAGRYNVKELMRISTILMENEKRGCDVIDNLSRESRYLWDERKISARECGKSIDTKMSYPLGILLILLIVITMAPALLNM